MTKYTETQFINTLPQNKKQKYIKQKNKNYPPSPLVTSFLKKEKYTTSKYKAPRIIQGRGTHYTLHLGCYIKKLEHHVYDIDKKRKRYEFAKGANPYEFARRIKYLSSKFKNPAFLEIDHTAFESHITTTMLKFEHSFYLKKYNNDPYLKKLLNQQLYNHARSNHGHQYSFSGMRCSGDCNTGFGNCIINLFIIKQIFRTLKIKIKTMVNGDDSLIILEETELHKINEKQIKAMFSQYNQETKIDNITKNIQDFTFCRLKYTTDDSNIPIMYTEPKRLQDIFGTTYKIQNTSRAQYLADISWANIQIYKNLQNYRQNFENIFNQYNHSTEKQIIKRLSHSEPVLVNLANNTKIEEITFDNSLDRCSKNRLTKLVLEQKPCKFKQTIANHLTKTTYQLSSIETIPLPRLTLSQSIKNFSIFYSQKLTQILFSTLDNMANSLE